MQKSLPNCPVQGFSCEHKILIIIIIQLIPFRRSPFARRFLVLLLENVLPEAEVAIVGILPRRSVLHEVIDIVVVVALIVLLEIRKLSKY